MEQNITIDLWGSLSLMLNQAMNWLVDLFNTTIHTIVNFSPFVWSIIALTVFVVILPLIEHCID